MTTPDTTKPAQHPMLMNAKDLAAYIDRKDEKHKAELKELRAVLRYREANEAK